MAKPLLRLVTCPPERIDARIQGAQAEHRSTAVSVPSGSHVVGPELAVLSDSELCQQAACGDPQAFEALYRRHVHFAYRLAVRLQGRDTDAEDTVHDAFLKAHAGLPDLREGSRFRAWLGSIVVSQVRGRMRRARLLRKLGIGGARPEETQEVLCQQASPEVKVQLAQVYTMLADIPADERIAWTLRHVQRHSLDEVAELVGVSLATVKRRIARTQSLLSASFSDAPESTRHGVLEIPSDQSGSRPAVGGCRKSGGELDE